MFYYPPLSNTLFCNNLSLHIICKGSLHPFVFTSSWLCILLNKVGHFLALKGFRRFTLTCAPPSIQMLDLTHIGHKLMWSLRGVQCDSCQMDCVENIDFPYYNYHDHVGLFDLSGLKWTPTMSPMVEMQSTIQQTMADKLPPIIPN